MTATAHKPAAAVLAALAMAACAPDLTSNIGGIPPVRRPDLGNPDAFFANPHICLPDGATAPSLRYASAVRCLRGEATNVPIGRFRAPTTGARPRVSGGTLLPFGEDLRIAQTYTPSASEPGRLDIVEDFLGNPNPPPAGDGDAVDTDVEVELVEADGAVTRFELRGAWVRGDGAEVTVYWYGEVTGRECKQWVSVVITGEFNATSGRFTVRAGEGDPDVAPGVGEAAVILWDAEEARLGACGFVRPNVNIERDGVAGYKWYGSLVRVTEAAQ